MMLKRCLLLVLAGFLLALPAAAQNKPPSVFTVSGVAVDNTAASATQAREVAREEGERRALRMLLERLTLKQDWSRLPKASDAALAGIVQDFEVESERSSPVRYLATLTFRFRPDPVRRMLREAGIPFTESRSKPLLVLPVFHAANRAVLWDDPNPWRAAWSKRSLAEGLVPVQRPLGELPDVQAIDADQAIKGDKAALAAISHRYGDADVLVAQATLSGKGDARVLDATAVRYGGALQDQSWVESVKPEANESDGDLLARGVAAVVADVSDAWKKATVVRSAESATISVTVRVSSLKDWLVVRDRLNGIPAIQRSDLVSLSRDGARVDIRYFGDEAQLQLVLSQRDLALVHAGGDWTLSAKGASGQ